MRYHSKESDRGRLKGKKSCVLIAVLMTAVSSFAAKDIVMFVGAHPDDVENCMGLALRMKDDYDVRVVDMTRGEGGCGTEGWRDGTTAVKRVAEERAVCKELGCEPVFLTAVNYRGRAYAEPYVTSEIEKLLTEWRPKAVFVNWPIDGHVDHVQCAAAVMHAVWNVRRDNGFDPKRFSTELYFYEEPAGETVNYRPLYYVDVTPTIRKAHEVICKYVCQNGKMIADRKLVRTAARGKEAPHAVEYAETYTTFNGERYPGGVLEKYQASFR